MGQLQLLVIHGKSFSFDTVSTLMNDLNAFEMHLLIHFTLTTPQMKLWRPLCGQFLDMQTLVTVCTVCTVVVYRSIMQMSWQKRI